MFTRGTDYELKKTNFIIDFNDRLVNRLLFLGIVIVPLVGNLINPSWQGFILLFLFFTIFHITEFISRSLNDLKILKVIRRDLQSIENINDLKFELLSNKRIMNVYWQVMFFELVTSLNEVSFFNPFTLRHSTFAKRTKKVPRLSRRILFGGYRFVINVVGTTKNISLGALHNYRSFNFKFLFFTEDSRGTTDKRRLYFAHEMGHFSTLSIASYYQFIPMLGKVMGIPLLLCCVPINIPIIFLLTTILTLYLYLARFVYPNKKQLYHLLDEAKADIYSIWITPVEILSRIKNPVGDIYSDHNLSLEDNSENSNNDLKKYREELIKGMYKIKMSARDISVDSFLNFLLGNRDHNGNYLIKQGHIAESIIAITYLIIGLKFYNVNNYSLLVAHSLAGAYLLIWVSVLFLVKREFFKLFELMSINKDSKNK